MKFISNEELRTSSVYVISSDDMTMYTNEYWEFVRSLYLHYVNENRGTPLTPQDIMDNAGDVYIWTDAYRLQKAVTDFTKFQKRDATNEVSYEAVSHTKLAEHIPKTPVLREDVWEGSVENPSNAFGTFIQNAINEIKEFQEANKTTEVDKPRIIFINTGFWAMPEFRRVMSALITSFGNDYLSKNYNLTVVLYGTDIPTEVQNTSYPRERERLNKTRIAKAFKYVGDSTTDKGFEAFCTYCENMVFTDIWIIKSEIEKAAELKEEEIDTKLVIKIIEDFRRLRIEATGILDYLGSEEKGLSAYGGKDDLKAFVKQTIAEVVLNPADAEKYGINAPDGVLLVSRLAGTGKSYFAKCLAGELGIPVFNFRMGSVMSKYVGESEQMMETALQALKSVGKCILYIDEVDQLGIRQSQSGDSGVTRRLFSRFLEFAGESDREVILIGSTNEVSHLDRAMLRKGRFSHVIFLGLPNEKERAEILKIQVELQSKLANSIDYKTIAKLTEWYTPAEISALVKEAITFQWHDAKMNGEDVPLSTKHFYYALDIININIDKRKAELELEKVEQKEFATPLINYVALLEQPPKSKKATTSKTKTKATEKTIKFQESVTNE